MADQTVDDRNLWRSVYRREGGWGPDSRFPGHRSAAEPVLVALDDELLCLHLGEPYGKGEHDVLDLRWTGLDPAEARRRAAELDALKEASRDAAADQDDAIAAAEAAVAEAVTWAPDAVVGTSVHYESGIGVRYENAVSTGIPAAAVHNGAVHVLLTVRDAEEPDSPARLVELAYDRPQGAGAAAARVWREGRALPVPGAEGAALVAFRGALHAFVPDLGGGVHCVRDDASGQWRRVEGQVEALAGASFLAAAAHADGVHVLAGGGSGRLVHTVFDGAAWTAPVEVEIEIEVAVSARVALASFDGALHAVLPGRGGRQLFHTVFDGTAWTPPVAVAGHDSRHAPGLLALTDGPEGDRRSALLMVHRGVEDFVPPPRPAPPAEPSVTGTGDWIVGATVEGYGSGGWSRARSHVEAGPAEFDGNGRATRGVLAEALVRAEYYWGFCYQADTAAIAGRAALYEVVAAPDGGERLEHRSDQDRFFSATAGAVSRSTVSWPDLAPGTYEVRFTGRRSGGHWSAPGVTGTVGVDLGDADLAVSTVRVTV
ncbi:hypothetical protein [Kitasatospora purpeofusca]|uniref:hypothetical protein n=1 Tax=Kitasatospora purpeofusca TaxID=67352 RepID=UPI00224F9F51|nr:hypothetical protein [Kitasatospora purpeofusca]MCX4755661.1 hypothetical protein [Kitasatospora purpeofusca]WSR36476.1 hypothetical protein OG715_39300 [Kitasatospora purpeofusca]